MTRRDPNAEPIVFRVLHLPNELRQALQGIRKQKQQTLEAYFRQIVDQGIGPLVQKLSAVLPNPAGSPRRPMRIPLSDRLLADLREAGNVTGIPSTRLLLALLQLATREPSGPGRRRGRKKRSAETPAEAAPTETREPSQAEEPRRGRSGRKRKPYLPGNLTPGHLQEGTSEQLVMADGLSA